METLNIYKPKECIKYMHVEIHPELAKEWYMGDLNRELVMAQVTLDVSADLCDHRLVMWSRRDESNEVILESDECNTGLLIMTAKEVAKLVKEHTLSQHVADVSLMSSRNITLVVFGTKDYYKSFNKNSAPAMTSLDLEMAFTDLLVSNNCDAVTVNTPNELALMILQTTKAIAEAPHKKVKHAIDEKAAFYMRGDNRKCVAVNADGVGVDRVWQQMLAVLPQSSLEAARALVSEYPSPLALYEELMKEDSVSKVSDIGVSRAAVPGTRPRRVGPEFAHKLHTLFTTLHGSVTL